MWEKYAGLFFQKSCVHGCCVVASLCTKARLVFSGCRLCLSWLPFMNVLHQRVPGTHQRSVLRHSLFLAITPSVMRTSVSINGLFYGGHPLDTHRFSAVSSRHCVVAVFGVARVAMDPRSSGCPFYACFCPGFVQRCFEQFCLDFLDEFARAL